MAITKLTNNVKSNDVIDKVNEIIDGIPSVVGTVSSASTNAQAVGAKLFYDTVGNIESALNTINSGS